MANNINNKKALAENIKQKLNSPEYVAMSDLITHDDRCGDMLAWLFGAGIDGNIHKKENWITGDNLNPGKGNKYKSEHMVCYDELEKDDWEEIVNLIKKRNEEKEQIFKQKRNNIKEKLNNTPNLYYRFSNNKRISTSYFVYPDKHGEYFHIWGVENGREYYLNININHPALNNFSWQKNGYYLIKTDKQIERNDKFGRPWSTGGETNPSNFHKWIEVGDQITITPYEIAEDKLVEKPKKQSSSETNNHNLIAVAGSEKKDNHQNAKKDLDEVEKNKTLEWITQYFKDNRIKEINLVDNELVITKDNNEVISSKNSHELRNIENQLEKTLKLEELQNLLNSTNSSSTPPNHNSLWIGIVIGGGIILTLGIVGWLINKKNKISKNK